MLRNTQIERLELSMPIMREGQFTFAKFVFSDIGSVGWQGASLLAWSGKGANGRFAAVPGSRAALGYLSLVWSGVMRILLLDAAFAAFPIYRYLTSQCDEVFTISNRPQDGLALACPERWIDGDYSDVDFVRAQIDELGITHVVPGCTDVSMATFSKLGGTPSYTHPVDVDVAINHKSKFRSICLKLALPMPRLICPDDLPTSGKFICKPANSFSGRGVTTFDGQDVEASLRAIELASEFSPSNEVVVEEFVEGELHSYSAFIEDGKVVQAFVVREGSRYDPFAVDTSYVVTDFDAAKRNVLCDAVERLAAHLTLCDGLVHTQFLDAEDRVAILEVTRRCPGDLYSMLISLSSGTDYAGRYASYFIGGDLPISFQTTKKILRHTVKQSGEHFFGFQLDELQSDGLAQLVPVAQMGQKLSTTVPVRTAVGFLEFDSTEKLEERYLQLINSE